MSAYKAIATSFRAFFEREYKKLCDFGYQKLLNERNIFSCLFQEDRLENYMKEYAFEKYGREITDIKSQEQLGHICQFLANSFSLIIDVGGAQSEGKITFAPQAADSVDRLLNVPIELTHQLPTGEAQSSKNRVASHVLSMPDKTTFEASIRGSALFESSFEPESESAGNAAANFAGKLSSSSSESSDDDESTEVHVHKHIKNESNISAALVGGSTTAPANKLVYHKNILENLHLVEVATERFKNKCLAAIKDIETERSCTHVCSDHPPFKKLRGPQRKRVLKNPKKCI